LDSPSACASGHNQILWNINREDAGDEGKQVTYLPYKHSKMEDDCYCKKVRSNSQNQSDAESQEIDKFHAHSLSSRVQRESTTNILVVYEADLFHKRIQHQGKCYHS
jgi:hypothetical protein